jgi:hypothetical protein
MFHLKEMPVGIDREIVMARLARKIGRGRDAIYHGTRHLPFAMRAGKLRPAGSLETSVFFTRSPEVAAYWASMMGDEWDPWSGGVLVLDRNSLARSYRLEPSRFAEDWSDEREESICGRTINFRRHLLGVVREKDIDAILSPKMHRPLGFFRWSERRKRAFYRQANIPASDFTKEGGGRR